MAAKKKPVTKTTMKSSKKATTAKATAPKKTVGYAGPKPMGGY